MARFDAVHPGRNTLESSKKACEIKNDEAKHAAYNYSALFFSFSFFVLEITSERDFYTVSLELLYVIGG